MNCPYCAKECKPYLQIRSCVVTKQGERIIGWVERNVCKATVHLQKQLVLYDLYKNGLVDMG